MEKESDFNNKADFRENEKKQAADGTQQTKKHALSEMLVFARGG